MSHGLAVDTTNVYWTNDGSDSRCKGIVVKAPVGGGAPVVLVRGPSDGAAFALTIDATSAYFTMPPKASTRGGGIMKVPLLGGPVTTLVLSDGDSAPLSIAVDGTSVYWMRSSGEVMSMGLNGGSPAMVASGAFSFPGLAVAGGSVYFMAAGGVMKVPVTGGMPTTLASVPGHETEAIAANATNVCWMGRRGIVTVPVGGGEVMTLVAGAHENIIANQGVSFALDAANVYWIDSAVKSVPVSGGTPVTLIPTLPGGASLAAAVMTVSATGLYWTEVLEEYGAFSRVMSLTPK
jgi:hypothetical protein